MTYCGKCGKPESQCTCSNTQISKPVDDEQRVKIPLGTGWFYGSHGNTSPVLDSVFSQILNMVHSVVECDHSIKEMRLNIQDNPVWFCSKCGIVLPDEK